MKIIYVSHWRFPSDKTMSPLIMRTCEEFARQGLEVELWVPRRINSQYGGKDPFLHYGIKPAFVIRKLPVLDLIEHIPGTLAFLLMKLTFAVSVWWGSKFVSGDTIWYAHDIRDVFFLRERPLFVEIHDFYESSANFLNRLVLARVWGLIVTNKIKMLYIGKKYGTSGDRMIHLPNAVDISRFDSQLTRNEARKKLALPLDQKLALYAGSLFGWKGVHTLALASPYLSENIKIIFAGGNEKERQDFREFIDEHNLKNITLLPLPYEDVGRPALLMRAADVLVLPNTAKDRASKYETSPVKLFQYMSSGTPIVASDLPSIRDIVSEKEVFFFEPDNPESLARAIDRVLQDPQESGRRAYASQEEVKKYSWEKRIEDIIRFLKKRI